jgi:hypothetical protein
LICTSGRNHVQGPDKDMSLELVKIVERPQRKPQGRFHSLAHLIDVPALERAYRWQRSDTAVGVDGVTKAHNIGSTWKPTSSLGTHG